MKLFAPTLCTLAVLGGALAAPQFLPQRHSESDSSFQEKDVFKADGEFEKFGRGGGVIRGEGEVFREHDSSSTSHQEQDFNRGGFFGPSGGSESDSSFQNRDVFEADGKFSESGRGGFKIEGDVFEEHESSGSSHQESSNRGGFLG